MSSYQDKIRARKRNQFQQKQQVNRLFAQRLSQGMTVAQAATTPYTVTDSDTLESIAGANGVNPTDVLAANPELKNIQTGMVINAPRPGSPQWRDQNMGGVGLPSNAALGGTTNNPQGNNPFRPLSPFQQDQQYRPPGYNQSEQGYRPPAAPASGVQPWNNMNYYTGGPQPTTPRGEPVTVRTRGQQYSYQSVQEGGALQTNYGMTAGTQQTAQPWMNMGYYTSGMAQQQAPRPNTTRPPSGQPGAFAQAIQDMTNRPAQPASPLQTATPPLGAYQAQYQYMSRNLYHQQIRTKADSGYLPTPGELNILEKMGFVKRDQTAGGGGYSWNKRRGGGRGRGGGGGGGGGGMGVPREPAFSTGAGFGGLVNWRI